MNFGLLLFWVCLSGVIATLSHEIEWLSQPALRIDPLQPIRWQATYDALREAHPGVQVGGFSRGEPAVMDGLAWSSYIIGPDGGWAQVRVDPHAARIVRADPTRLYLQDFVRQLHYNFLDAGWLGFYLVSFVAFPMLFSIISALLFFKRWWRHLFRLRIGRGAQAFVSSLHRVTGVWALVFGMVIAVTGVWYLIEADLVPREVVYPEVPKVPVEKLAGHGPTPRMLPLDQYVDAARTAFPELEPTGIALPDSPGGSVQVQGRADRVLVRNRANAVFLDPYDGSVLAVRDSSREGALSWWVNAADALHFGYWGGLASKILWASFGLCLPVMVLTGGWLSWRRAGLVGAGTASTGRGAPSEVSWWRRRPLRTWLLLPLTALLVASVIAGHERRAAAPAAFVEVGEVRIGPWTARVTREPGHRPGAALRYAVAFDAGPSKVASFRRATLSRQTGDDAPAPAALQGPPGSMRVGLPVTEYASGTLRLTVEGWGEERFEASLSDAAVAPASGTVRRYRPAAPGVFYAILFGYAVVSLFAAAGWFALDRVPAASRARRASGGTESGATPTSTTISTASGATSCAPRTAPRT